MDLESPKCAFNVSFTECSDNDSVSCSVGSWTATVRFSDAHSGISKIWATKGNWTHEQEIIQFFKENSTGKLLGSLIQLVARSLNKWLADSMNEWKSNYQQILLTNLLFFSNYYYQN